MSENLGVVPAICQAHRAMAEELFISGQLLMNFQPAVKTSRFKPGIIVYIELLMIHIDQQYMRYGGISKRILTGDLVWFTDPYIRIIFRQNIKLDRRVWHASGQATRICFSSQNRMKIDYFGSAMAGQ
jgi:hypothetical protein